MWEPQLCLWDGLHFGPLPIWSWTLHIVLILGSQWGLALYAVHVLGVSNVLFDSLSEFCPGVMTKCKCQKNNVLSE